MFFFNKKGVFKFNNKLGNRNIHEKKEFKNNIYICSNLKSKKYEITVVNFSVCIFPLWFFTK